jgi:hypothetical protein
MESAGPIPPIVANCTIYLVYLDQMHAMLKNMLRTVTHTVRRLSQEVAALAQ